MYSRKQFLVKALQKVTQLIGATPFCSPPLQEPESPNSNDFDTKRLFQQAMALGIDPGTMDIIQLSRIVTQAEQVDTKTRS